LWLLNRIKEQFEVLKLLASYGANVNFKSEDGSHAIHLAAGIGEFVTS
jgi:hypothetical protein